MVKRESLPSDQKQTSLLGSFKRQPPISEQIAGKKLTDKKLKACEILGMDAQNTLIRKSRKRRAIDQTTLAKKSGLPLSTYKKIESTEAIADPHDLTCISHASGASPVSFCSKPSPVVLDLQARVSDKLKFVQHVSLSEGYKFDCPLPKHDPPLASLKELEEDREVSAAIERLISTKKSPYSEMAEAQIQAYEAIQKYTGKVVVTQIICPGTGIMNGLLWFKFSIWLIRNYQRTGAAYRNASYDIRMSQDKFEMARDNIDIYLDKRNIFEDLGLELMTYDSAKRQFETYQDHTENDEPKGLLADAVKALKEENDTDASNQEANMDKK